MRAWVWVVGVGVALPRRVSHPSPVCRRMKPNKKRIAKNAKYGSGGATRADKKNDASSAASFKGFSPRQNKTPFPGTAKPEGKKAKKGAAAKRPGKARRKQGGRR